MGEPDHMIKKIMYISFLFLSLSIFPVSAFAGGGGDGSCNPNEYGVAEPSSLILLAGAGVSLYIARRGKKRK
jgi:hypothetical protein